MQSLEAHRLMVKSKPECLSTVEKTSDEADSALEKSVSLCSVASEPSNSPASGASKEDDSFAVKTQLLLRCKAHRILLTLQKTDLLTLVVTVRVPKPETRSGLKRTIRAKSDSARPVSQSTSCCAADRCTWNWNCEALLIVFLPRERADAL